MNTSDPYDHLQDLLGNPPDGKTPIQIETRYVYPPIPNRRFDWEAYDALSYDGDPESSAPIGRGPTRADAILDLMEQIEERQS